VGKDKISFIENNVVHCKILQQVCVFSTYIIYENTFIISLILATGDYT